VFLLSLLAGFVSYQVPEAIFFAIIILATLLLSAKFTAKSLAAIILGYGAATYFVVAVEGWFGVDVFTSYKNSLSALSFGLPSVSWIDNYGLLIWPMLAIFSILVLLSFKKRLNNLQRKVIDLWVILVILLILASFSLGNKTFWLSMLVYSIAYALSLTIEAVQNRWVKDSIYLLVLLSLYSIFLITWVWREIWPQINRAGLLFAVSQIFKHPAFPNHPLKRASLIQWLQKDPSYPKE